MRVDLLVFKDSRVNANLKDEFFGLNEISPSEELLSILDPHFMNLDLLEDHRFFVVFKGEHDILALEVIRRILETLDFLKVNFLLIFSEFVAASFPSITELLAFGLQPEIHQETSLSEYADVLDFGIFEDQLPEEINHFDDGEKLDAEIMLLQNVGDILQVEESQLRLDEGPL